MKIMKFVQPIRDLEQIQQIKEYLKEENERNYILFVMGINTGLYLLHLISLSCFINRKVRSEKVDTRT